MRKEKESLYVNFSMFVAMDMISKVLKSCSFLNLTVSHSISFQNHVGLHPTLGSIDHICFSPLFCQDGFDENHRNAFLHQCNDVAKRFAEEYYQDFRVPVYLYVQIAEGRRLQDIRRSLGYFQATSSHLLAKVLQEKMKENAAAINPSSGSWEDYHPDRGVTCIGCVPLIQNYNIRIRPTASYWSKNGKTSNAKASIAQITKQLRSKTVEALTLPYNTTTTEEESCVDVYEIACNLLNPYPPDGTTSHQVYETVQTLSQEIGMEIIADYSTNPLESELIDKYKQYKKEEEKDHRR